MRKLFLSLFLTLTSIRSLASDSKPQAWTYFFYIAGDFYFEGPTLREDSRLKLEDQAHALYELVYRTAKSDKVNNYALFFDPKGRAAPFSERHVRFRYLERGRKVESNGIFEGEIDSTRTETLERFFAEAKTSIPSLKDTHNLFFFYGEHVPEMKPAVSQDLSQPEGGLHIGILAEALKSSTISWELQIYQSCSMNTVETVLQLGPLSRQLILAEGLVSRTVLPGINTILTTRLSPQAWTTEFLKAAKVSPFPHPFFEAPRRSDRNWSKLLDSFVRATTIDQEDVRWKQLRTEWTDLRMAESGQTTGPLLVEALQDPIEILSEAEHMISLRDYVTLRSRLSDSVVSDPKLGAIQELLSDPNLKKLRVRVPTPQ